MAKPNQGINEESKEPFVSQEDRPEVRINLETPLSELRVRELSAILGLLVGKNPNFEVGKSFLKEFFDKDFPEEVKDFLKEAKPEIVDKNWKLEGKSEKFEKLEKFEKPEIKEGKEKSEIKENKNEKIEGREQVFDPGNWVGPDPRMEQVIQALTGLTKQVSKLANQVEELQKKVSG